MRWSVIALAALVAYSWAAGEFRFDEFLSERRIENLKRFSEESRRCRSRAARGNGALRGHGWGNSCPEMACRPPRRR